MVALVSTRKSASLCVYVCVLETLCGRADDGDDQPASTKSCFPVYTATKGSVLYVNQRGLLLPLLVIVAEMMEMVVQLMDRGDELMRRTYRVVVHRW